MQNELPIHVHSDSDGENSLPGRNCRREYIPSKQHSALGDREWCARELQSQYEQPNNWIIAGLHRMKCTLASTATSICKLHLAIRDRPTRSIYPFLYLFCGQCFMYGAIIATLGQSGAFLFTMDTRREELCKRLLLTTKTIRSTHIFTLRLINLLLTMY